MDVLSRQKISACLQPAVQHKLSDIYIFEQLDSTNTWLLNNKQCGALCLAETQSAGRGRQGNHWVSAALGNIYLSYCYCFDTLPKNFSLSTLAVGITVCEALHDIGLRGHGLKWPNDIYFNQCKLGGILLETAGNLKQVVIGIGLNIRLEQQTQIAQPWCCLDDVLAVSVDRNRLIAFILNHLHIQLNALQQGRSEWFKSQWEKWDILLNTVVSVKRGKQQMQGMVVDIDTMGQLGIQFDQGGLQYLNAAEIKIRC